ncbi:Glutathione S-transferase [Mycena sanguinolenta]|uniref:glutathione transferase n=1 Tax=Mycena sanguinolenta TaxID=230812 RepID=A0A8H6Y385_9AGAR|nr:Glutathione S-transferase [Mycena sanguinolenta]
MPSSDTPKITLHWLERSRAQRILWLLEETNVPYEIKTYKRAPNQVAPPELKAVHPLGKSPVLTIGDMNLAESALIVEYLCEHFGPHLIPTKWKPGCEGKVAGESEAYMRHRYFMHYAEGSLFPLIFTWILANGIRNAPVPFFIRPITSRVSGYISTEYLDPNFATTFAFLEDQLASAPDGGPYLCGNAITGADILMSFPVMVILSEMGERGPKKQTFPKLFAYVDALKTSESFKRAVDKIVALEGEYVLI